MRNLLGLGRFPGAGRWAAATLIDAIGSGLLIPLTVLYFTLHAGLSVGSVGLGLSVGGLLALGFVPVGGALVDRRGAKSVLLGAMALAGVAIAAYAGVRSWPELVIVVSVAEIASAAMSVARKAMLIDLAAGSQRVALMASQRSLRNLGFGIGGILAGVATGMGGSAFTDVVYLDALSYVLAMLFIAGLHVPRPVHEQIHRRLGAGLREVVGDGSYLALTVADFFVSFYDSAFAVALPLWVVFHTHAPRALVGVLFTLNTTIVVIVQVRATRQITGLARVRRAYAMVIVSITGTAATWWLAGHSGAVLGSGLLVVGLVGLTVAEMFASSGEWVVSIDAAPAHSRGSYLSVFALGGSLQDALGPTIITALLSLDGALLWAVLAAMVCGGSLATVHIIARRAPVAHPAQ